jgi:hypothetical protein
MPIGLVVKKGSKARATTSGGMPTPLSLTVSDTYCPIGRSRPRAVRASIQRLAVSTTSLPPSGMASRALMHRLSSAFSSCPGSACTFHSPTAATFSSSICGPERAAQQLFHVGHQPVGVDRLGLQRLAAREGQQPVRERRGALHRACATPM